MKVYWREHRTGQRLILDSGAGQEEEVGGIRRTPRGFDALAKTLGYDPGRAQKGFATLEEAKAFVEDFPAVGYIRGQRAGGVRQDRVPYAGG